MAVPNAVREGIRPHRGTLALPQVSVAGTAVATSLRRVYANAHAYHVNSVDPNSDGEHFISADDLRINMWNLEITDRSFSEFSFVFEKGGKHRSTQAQSFSFNSNATKRELGLY